MYTRRSPVGLPYVPRWPSISPPNEKAIEKMQANNYEQFFSEEYRSRAWDWSYCFDDRHDYHTCVNFTIRIRHLGLLTRAKNDLTAWSVHHMHVCRLWAAWISDARGVHLLSQFPKVEPHPDTR